MHDNQWTQVRSTTSLIEADMLRDLLEREGISGLVQPSDASAYLGAMSPCRLLVKACDAERAIAYLHDLEHSELDLESIDFEGDGEP
jgi:predicted xylose isomerase-like sugar epimerase